MANTDKIGRTKFSRRERLWLAAAGIGLLGLLGIAVMLRPSPAGYGTHQQLGLPPCTFSVLFGRPCPTCGMTTAWAYMMRGHWHEAFRANVGGVLLGLLAMLAAPWLLGSALRGSWILISPDGRVAVAIAAAVLLATTIDWAIRMLAY